MKSRYNETYWHVLCIANGRWSNYGNSKSNHVSLSFHHESHLQALLSPISLSPITCICIYVCGFVCVCTFTLAISYAFTSFLSSIASFLLVCKSIFPLPTTCMLLYGLQANANTYQSCYISSWYRIPNPRHPDRSWRELIQLDESFRNEGNSQWVPDKQRDIYLSSGEPGDFSPLHVSASKKSSSIIDMTFYDTCRATFDSNF